MKGSLRERLHEHIDVLALKIGERHIGRPRALAAAARYIEGALARTGRDVRRQSYKAGAIECSNLQVELTGVERPGDILLVGAHYDTVEGSPGADDNASGVAAMIEIASLLSRRRLRSTVRCVAFVNEEPPFFYSRQMGSAVYARAARARGDDIRLMVSLEMLGYYSARSGSQHYPPLLGLFYPDRANFIAFVSNLGSRRELARLCGAFRSNCTFPSERLASPAIVPGVSWSDQLSFWRAGYPAVMVTDTAFYRYPHYHAPTDTPEKLNYVALARVTAGLADAVASLAD
jgi:Zn-dependent M28 family amino/carboxypeptidase